MDRNNIMTEDFSNPQTRVEYLKKIERHQSIAFQCGECSFYAALNADYGFCYYEKSRFWRETVFEHFGCDQQVQEGWGAHSFQEEHRLHVNMDDLLALLGISD